MEIKFITSTGESTQESDYETAVDIAHYSIDDFKYFFETVNGLKIVLSSYSTTTTMSYLEPDFDEIEEDHKNGTTKDHYAYHSHSSSQPSTHREELNMWVELPVEKIVLSVAEMEVYEQYLKNPKNYSTVYKELNDKYTPEFVYKLTTYDEQQQYNEPDHYPVSMSKQEMQLIYHSFMHNVKEKSFVDIDLPKHIHDQLISYEQMHLIIDAKNKANEPIQKENEIKAYENIANNKLFSESLLITGILNNHPINNEQTQLINVNNLSENMNESKKSVFSKIKKIFK